MVLRLVLVGIVAGMGLTLPSLRDIDAWGRKAERWANRQLAEWDAQKPIADDGAYVYVTEPAPVVTNPVTVPPAPVVADGNFAAVVDELAADFARNPEPASGTGPDPIVLVGDSSEPLPGATAVALAFDLPVEPVAYEPEPEPAPEADAKPEPTAEPQPKAELELTLEPKPAADPDLAFGTAMRDVVSTFATDLALNAEPTDPDGRFVDLVAGMAADFASDPLVIADRDAASPPERPAFEPLEVGEDLYAGEAYALNRAAEGITAPAPTSPAQPRAEEDGLTHAVRLTREAVVAWASLLHGPAVVTIRR